MPEVLLKELATKCPSAFVHGLPLLISSFDFDRQPIKVGWKIRLDSNSSSLRCMNGIIDRLENSADPDQTAHRSSLIRICTDCKGVPVFRKITVILKA